MANDPNALAYGGANVVKVKNTGDVVFRDGFDGTTYAIPPGEEAFLPAAAVLLWFGDNGLFNIDARTKPREKEVQRLRVKYGVYGDHDSWDSKTPSVEVYTLQGDRVYTLIEDIDGTKADEAAGESDTAGGTDIISDRMEALEAELRALRTALATQDSANKAQSQSDAQDDGGDDADADNADNADDNSHTPSGDGSDGGGAGKPKSTDKDGSAPPPPAAGKAADLPAAKKDGPSTPGVKKDGA